MDTPSTPALIHGHFPFLKNIHIGDIISIQTIENNVQTFKAIKAEIVHKDKVEGINNFALNTRPQLALITGYPFDRLGANTSTRYKITVERIKLDAPANSYLNLSAFARNFVRNSRHTALKA